MQDDSDTSPAENDRGPGIGERLTHARESRGLTIDAAAQDLHVDPSVLRALENEDFDALGAPVFAKGHMRKYGVLLELPVDDLLLDYYTKHEPREVPLQATDFAQIARTEKRGQWFAIAFAITALVALAVLVAWLYRKTDVAELGTEVAGQIVEPVTVPVSSPLPRPDKTDNDEQAPIGNTGETRSVALALPPDQNPESVSQTGDQTAEISATGTDVTQDQNQDNTGATVSAINDSTVVIDDEAVAEPVSEPAAPPINVVFEFEEDSWVELYDANRQRLVYDLGRAASRRSVSAEPPVQVFLGNAAGVTLTVDGRAYEIQSRDMRGQTARFTLGTP
jgi:cytoskeleton protein RodZ